MTSQKDIIGILGGGQLGKMIAIAANKLGYRTCLYCPKGDNPAEDYVDEYLHGNWEDVKKLGIFASRVTVITSEFENVPATTLNLLSKKAKVHPSSLPFRIAQKRNKEKKLAHKAGFSVPKWYRIRSFKDLEKYTELLNYDCILKTNSFGYDGKGQILIKQTLDLKQAWKQINFKDCILEEKINFDRELSILYAKSINGTDCFFPLSENYHKNGILNYTIAPAKIDLKLKSDLKLIVKKFADLLNLRGLLTVEIFQKQNNFIFNEIAPRPHNSFHWTIEGCKKSQFDILVKSIIGKDIKDQSICRKWKMINILGDDINNLKSFNFHKDQQIHVYGKKEIKHGRKMGHITYPI